MLKINLFGKTLNSPLILASGSLGENKENLIKALKYGAGAVVTRTLRLQTKKRKVFSPAYYIEKEKYYMLNVENQNFTPWYYWLDKVEEIEKYGRLIVSLSVRNPNDCKIIISAFEKRTPPSFYEFNFSCPHSAKLYGEISYEKVEKALRIARKLTKQPLFLKLTLNNIDLKKLKFFEKEKLVDALVISNSIGPGLRINVETKKPFLKSVIGGMSGKAIKPLVLAAIYEIKKHLKIPIIGVGGIENAEDVLEYIILGCVAVQIYTAAYIYGLQIFEKITRDLKRKLKGRRIENFRDTLKLWK